MRSLFFHTVGVAPMMGYPTGPGIPNRFHCGISTRVTQPWWRYNEELSIPVCSGAETTGPLQLQRLLRPMLAASVFLCTKRVLRRKGWNFRLFLPPYLFLVIWVSLFCKYSTDLSPPLRLPILLTFMPPGVSCFVITSHRAVRNIYDLCILVRF